VVAVRKLSHSEPSIRIYVWYSLANVAFTGVAMPYVWIWPDLSDGLFLLGIGLLGTVSQYWFLMAYRYASATIIAPFDYVRLPFALALGYFIWNELPTNWAFVGSAIIIGSGIYIWWREKSLAARDAKPETPRPAD